MIHITRRQVIVLAIVLAMLVGLTLLLAPNVQKERQYGSTYSRAPQGYAAWYAFMQERGTPLQRWQQPINLLIDPDGALLDPAQKDAKSSQTANRLAKPTPITLIQIQTSEILINPASGFWNQWLNQGNVLILLSKRSRVTDAPFTSDVQSEWGPIRIDTRRRQTFKKLEKSEAAIFSDQFGAIVWQKTYGKGRIIYASTPYLAANAYQDFRANFELLAKVATEPGLPIWVDEYLNGYRNPPKSKTSLSEETIWLYLIKTPLSLLAIQAIVVLLVALWGQRHRFGAPARLTEPIVDNSTAYIQAMAGVLHKAHCSEFVVETIGKAEQLNIQNQLGLGSTLLPFDQVVQAWQQQIGQTEDLRSLLQISTQHPRLSDPELQKWMETLQRVKQKL